MAKKIEYQENTIGYVRKNITRNTEKNSRKILRRFVTKKSKDEPTQGCHKILWKSGPMQKDDSKKYRKIYQKKNVK